MYIASRVATPLIAALEALKLLQYYGGSSLSPINCTGGILAMYNTWLAFRVTFLLASLLSAADICCDHWLFVYY